MMLEFNSQEPIYLQIIRYFKQQIVLGTLKCGDEIPSRRELAATLKVNANTVQRAYKEMEEMGIIETVKNFQSTVTTNERSIQMLRNELISDAVTGLVKALKPIGVDKDEVKKIIDESWK